MTKIPSPVSSLAASPQGPSAWLMVDSEPPTTTLVCANLGISSLSLHNSILLGIQNIPQPFSIPPDYTWAFPLSHIFYLSFHPDSWSNMGPEPIWLSLEFSENCPEPQKALNLGTQARVTQSKFTGSLQGNELPQADSRPLEAMVTMFIRDLGFSWDEAIRSRINAIY